MDFQYAFGALLTIAIAVIGYLAKDAQSKADTRMDSMEKKFKEGIDRVETGLTLFRQVYDAQTLANQQWKDTLPETYARRDDVVNAMTRVEHSIEKVEEAQQQGFRDLGAKIDRMATAQ